MIEADKIFTASSLFANSEYGNINDVFTVKELRDARYLIGTKFEKEVKEGLIDPDTSLPYKCNEKKVIALTDRLRDDYKDIYVYHEEFTNGILKHKGKFWRKSFKMSDNIYYIWDYYNVIENLQVTAFIKSILARENNEVVKYNCKYFPKRYEKYIDKKYDSIPWFMKIFK